MDSNRFTDICDTEDMPETVDDHTKRRILPKMEENPPGDPPGAVMREPLQSLRNVADKMTFKPGAVFTLESNFVIMDNDQMVGHTV
jgi:hypothetical protein